MSLEAVLRLESANESEHALEIYDKTAPRVIHRFWFEWQT